MVWFLENGYIKTEGKNYNIASVNSHRTTEGMANAKLISAAPELLDALERYIDECEGDCTRLNPRYEQARKAIAKARGQS